MLLQAQRDQVVEYGKKLVEAGLTVGTFGNLSVYDRESGLMAISPSGMDYFKTTPEDVALVDLDGVQQDGPRKPSSEVDMHRLLYRRRSDVSAVVHTHSPAATTLACLGWAIEPIHYLVAYSGRDVPCIPYYPFGTMELAEAAANAMGNDHNACLLGNHGLLSAGGALPFAFDVAQQTEFLSEIYYRTRLAGGGVLLTEQQLSSVLHVFEHYRKA